MEGLQDAAGVMDIVDRFNSIPKAKSHSKSSTGSAATASAQDTRISYQQPSGAVHHGDAAISAMQADSAQREKDNEYSDLEIEEMVRSKK